MPKRLTTEEFISKAKAVHGNKYNYSNTIYKNSYTKVKIACPIHGDFFQSRSNHLFGKGCSKCNGGILSNTSQFIKKARKVHGNRYDYSKVNYINDNQKVEIRCKLHGFFWQESTNHLQKNGCPKCAMDVNRCTLDEFVKKANKIHNNIYDYSKSLYINANTRVEIICKKHGSFFQRPNKHLATRGCPNCHISKGESKIKQYLENICVTYESQKTFLDFKNPTTNHRLRFDFYIPSKNLLIEYNGKQHYTNSFVGKYKTTIKDLKYGQFKDKIKRKYCIDKSIKLLIIKYDDYSNIESILKKELNLS